MKRITILLTGLLVLLLGCGNFVTGPAVSTQSKEARAFFVPPGIAKLTSARADGFFAAPTSGGTHAVFASTLATGLADGETPFIIDIRGAAAYAAGHIPGAVNIPLGVLFQPENLAKIPTDGRPVVTVCVTGHTASMAMSVLGTLGYNAYVLRFGMMAWNASTAMPIFSPDQTQTIYGLGGPTDSVVPETATYSVKPLDIPPGIYRQIAARASTFFAAPSSGGSHTVFASTLATGLVDGETPFIIDVRGAAAYAAGHIPAAVNIPLGVLFQPENLAKIPTDGRPVVTVCVTGHTASMAMSVLGTLGYNAYVLRFGMMGWSESTVMPIYSPDQTQIIYGLDGAIEPESIIVS